MPSYANGIGYFLYVESISDVYSYSNVPRGGSAFFMDKNSPIMYVKSVDAMNQANVEAYDLVKRQIMPQAPANQFLPQDVQQSDFVRRDELTSIISETIRNELRAHNNGFRNRNKNKESGREDET